MTVTVLLDGQAARYRDVRALHLVGKDAAQRILVLLHMNISEIHALCDLMWWAQDENIEKVYAQRQLDLFLMSTVLPGQPVATVHGENLVFFTKILKSASSYAGFSAPMRGVIESFLAAIV